MANLLDVLFGCSHKNYTFPITMKTKQRRGPASATRTYVVCLDCGKEFPYDWEQMRIVTRARPTQSVSAIAKPAESCKAA